MKPLFILMLAAFSLIPALEVLSQENLTKEKAKEYTKQAAAFFKSENYKEASKLYEQLSLYKPDDATYHYYHGVCILKSNNVRTLAIIPLEKASSGILKAKDVNFYLACAYMYDGDFDKAIELFEQFKSTVKGKAVEVYRVDLHLAWCYNAKELVKIPIVVDISNIVNINSEYDDYNPLVEASDSVIIFSSNRNSNQGRTLDKKGEYPSDVYVSTTKDIHRPRVKNLGINVNGWFYDRSLSFLPNGQTILLSKENEKGQIDLYTCSKGGRSFGKAEILSDKFYTKYQEHNGCLSADGEQLFFAADIKGGFGGLDIYRCEKQSNGVWTDPINLGDEVNTPYNEDNPQLYIDGITLFFSSEGHNSMGGLDVFKTVKPSPQQGWSKPVNMGYPVNDCYDNNDFFLSAIPEVAYYSAVREDGEGGRDIYRAKFEKEVVKTNLRSVFIQVLNPSGQVSKNTAVMISRKSTGENLGRVVTGSFGEITQFMVPGEYSLIVKTRKLGQFEQSMTIPDSDERSVHILVKLID